MDNMSTILVKFSTKKWSHHQSSQNINICQFKGLFGKISFMETAFEDFLLWRFWWFFGMGDYKCPEIVSFAGSLRLWSQHFLLFLLLFWVVDFDLRNLWSHLQLLLLLLFLYLHNLFNATPLLAAFLPALLLKLTLLLIDRPRKYMFIVLPAILKIDSSNRDGRSTKLGLFFGLWLVQPDMILDFRLIQLMTNGKIIFLDGFHFAVAEESQPSNNNQFE